MRRVSTFVVMLVFLLTSGLVAAQKQESLWTAGETFTVNDIGFSFTMPEGWLHDTGSSGLVFASNKKDLAAVADDDPDTDPAEPAFLLSAFAGEKVGVDTNLPLSEIADGIMSGSGLTETEDRVDLKVMGRHTINAFGRAEDGTEGIVTLWVEDGYVVVFAAQGGTNLRAAEIAYSWGGVLGSAEPIGYEALSETDTLTGAATGLNISIPDGWYLNSDANIAFRSKEDFKNNEFSDAVMALVENTTSDLGLSKNPTKAEITEAVSKAYELENVIAEEFYLGNLLAYGVEGEDGTGTGQYGIIITALDGKQAAQLIFVASSREDYEALKPTLLAMLHLSKQAS